MREAEKIEAARRLGMDEVVFLRCPDGSLMPDLDLREKIVRMIRAHKPDVIITHDPFRPYALHPDHRAVGLATTDAVYPTARDPLYFPEHLQEGLEPHKTAEIWYFGPEHPDKIVDITGTFDRKIDALRAHESQVGYGAELETRMRDRAKELAEGPAVRARRGIQGHPDATLTEVGRVGQSVSDDLRTPDSRLRSRLGGYDGSVRGDRRPARVSSAPSRPVATRSGRPG